jgi:hypothetical protein
MFDGAELGKAIAAHPGDIEAALAVYEGALFSRSESAAVDAHVILGLCLDDRAPYPDSSISSPVPSRWSTHHLGSPDR